MRYSCRNGIGIDDQVRPPEVSGEFYPVLYESPLQMLADSPSHYLREPMVMDFLAAVPTVWDETHALTAKIGDRSVAARRRGAEWYLGATSDGEAQTLQVELSFLDEDQPYRLIGWRDGPNADRYAEDFQKRTQTVTPDDTLTIEMATGGGFAGRFLPIEE